MNRLYLSGVLAALLISTSAVAAMDERLGEAARQGDLATIKALAKSGVNLNESDDSGYTALILALYHDQPAVTRYLLAQGADPNRADNHGRTALMGAAFKGDTKAADILLADSRTQINLQNPQGQTAAMYAALFGHKVFLQHLVAKGARLDIKDAKGNTAASLAESQGNQELANWIKQQQHAG
ncbi:ankyrin repeat domain-containing protein [Shimwellia pseudoproteus]|uniref:ankyrin repeat domain-containing protein n=1 Tax=Shimwellia pseudoproteus TaxID=570012 RepID=UPI0018EAC0DB|nr:ankyrin repeat domain-containing protein [Shimwellia pseudoproteus]MBJ3816867.1 ankyrin repeat domain-containing protein [Shimwellia pseudoproteus]